MLASLLQCIDPGKGQLDAPGEFVGAVGKQSGKGFSHLADIHLELLHLLHMLQVHLEIHIQTEGQAGNGRFQAEALIGSRFGSAGTGFVDFIAQAVNVESKTFYRT